MDISASIVFAGVANATLLAGVSALNWRRHPAAAWLCVLLALLSLAAAGILIQHRVDGAAERIAVTVEHLAAYSAAPALYFFVLSAVGPAVRTKGRWLHFGPAALYLLIGAPLTLTGRAEPPAYELTVAYMIAYTLAAFVPVIRSWAEDGFGPRLAWPAAILAMMSAIHAGQLVRLTSDSPAVQDIVAVIGALAVFGLLLLALAGLLPWALSAVTRYARSSASSDELRTAFETLRARLVDEELYRRPDLRLSQLAASAGLSAHQASQALSQAGHVTFHELIAQCRVAEAKRLLALPENARVAVEPIGMMSGFRSRSAFYEAFQRLIGMTPAEYRRCAHKQSCPDQPERTRKR